MQESFSHRNSQPFLPSGLGLGKGWAFLSDWDALLGWDGGQHSVTGRDLWLQITERRGVLRALGMPLMPCRLSPGLHTMGNGEVRCEMGTCTSRATWLPVTAPPPHPPTPSQSPFSGSPAYHQSQVMGPDPARPSPSHTSPGLAPSPANPTSSLLWPSS